MEDGHESRGDGGGMACEISESPLKTLLVPFFCGSFELRVFGSEIIALRGQWMLFN